MTDMEAIEVLKMDCDLITFDPMTGENIDLETVKLMNNLNYICYLANKIAISALQEREERNKGCKYCLDYKGDVNRFCPHCGRPLKED